MLCIARRLEGVEDGQSHLVVVLFVLSMCVADDNLECATHLVARSVAGRVHDAMAADTEETARRLCAAETRSEYRKLLK